MIIHFKFSFYTFVQFFLFRFWFFFYIFHYFIIYVKQGLCVYCKYNKTVYICMCCSMCKVSRNDGDFCTENCYLLDVLVWEWSKVLTPFKETLCDVCKCEIFLCFNIHIQVFVIMWCSTSPILLCKCWGISLLLLYIPYNCLFFAICLLLKNKFFVILIKFFMFLSLH